MNVSSVSCCKNIVADDTLVDADCETGIVADGVEIGIVADGVEVGIVADGVGIIADGAGIVADGAGIVADGVGIIAECVGIVADCVGIVADGVKGTALRGLEGWLAGLIEIKLSIEFDSFGLFGLHVGIRELLGSMRFSDCLCC